MWNDKKKAITFSFDDGVTQDIRLVELFNKYGLKCTFNINSGYLGVPNLNFHCNNHIISHSKIPASKVKEIYEGHEIAVHTLTHPTLTFLDEETIIRQVEEDRKALEGLCGYPVVGMAYPNGPNDDRVAGIIGKNTPIKYSRTVTETFSYDLQKSNLLRFNPTIHCSNPRLDGVVNHFLSLKTDEPQLLYIWGHSYEFDAELCTWEKFEEICKRLAGREDIFYCTNKEALL